MSKTHASHQTPFSQPCAVQIVSIRNDEFTFHEDSFRKILSQIPQQYKISVLSVVGAFRTGKSFLLSWILRYLHHHHTNKSRTCRARENQSKQWYHNFDKLDSNSGFHWRGGSDRDTTGIWMWSEPFLMEANTTCNSSNEPMALVLLDTQGMFDHDTSMKLTASIFGLSTLFSSFQIYNVMKLIQEDNLQQLALFSEYGRVAATTNNESTQKPFQRIEFLVRDWQNFEANPDGDIEPLEKEMSAYLTSVLAERQIEELQGTRDQITNCFDEISCYMLTHPGLPVTKNSYDGDTSKVDLTFLRLLDRFCQRVLSGKCLQPKKIHGRELTVTEFINYAKEYAALFKDGARFPKATTLLEAHANANNSNAIEENIKFYQEYMDCAAGTKVDFYLEPSALKKIHQHIYDLALKRFDFKANFGDSSEREKCKQKLIKDLEDNWNEYRELNEGRRPSLGKKMFIRLVRPFIWTGVASTIFPTVCKTYLLRLEPKLTGLFSSKARERIENNFRFQQFNIELLKVMRERVEAKTNEIVNLFFK